MVYLFLYINTSGILESPIQATRGELGNPPDGTQNNPLVGLSETVFKYCGIKVFRERKWETNPEECRGWGAWEGGSHRHTRLSQLIDTTDRVET